MAEINWDTLGFDAYKTKVIIKAENHSGQWTPVTEDDSFSMVMDPFSCVFHYAISCFEGLKAFRHKDGRIFMFRPLENAHRMQRTAKYLGLPAPSDEMFIDMCERVIRRNQEFLPPYGRGCSLYIRPLLLGSMPQMQLVPPKDVTFVVMCAPAGSYYGAFMKSFSAVIPRNYDRAAPLGSGSYKVGANYASTFKPYKIAHEQGYVELLYLNSKTHENIDEFGSSNFFGIKGNKYITPASDSILPSITNKTLQQVAIDMGMTVEKRAVPLTELDELDEAAACGTAVVITPLSHIHDKPVLEEDYVAKEWRYFPNGVVGPVCQKLFKTVTGIQNGDLPDTHGWLHEVKL